MSVTASESAEVLGGRRALGRKVTSMTELDSLVREGIPKPALDRFIDALTAPHHRADLRTTLRNKIVPRATS